MKRIIYEWGTEVQFSKLARKPTKRAAQPVGEALEALRRAQGGYLKPATVVMAAKARSSPLHPYFTWDNKAAAARWRLAQAGQLIAAVQLVRTNGHQLRTRAFVALSQQPGSRGYESITEILSDAEKYAQLLRRALQELELVRSRYAEVKELGRLFKELDRVMERTSTKRSGR